MTTFAYTFWIMMAIIFFIKNFKNSALGRCCLAIRENEIAADTMGINTTKYKVMAFTLGAGPIEPRQCNHLNIQHGGNPKNQRDIL